MLPLSTAKITRTTKMQKGRPERDYVWSCKLSPCSKLSDHVTNVLETVALGNTHRSQLSSNPNSPNESNDLSQAFKGSKSVISDSTGSGDNLDITFEKH